MQRKAKARLTGLTVPHPKGIIYEVICPACDRPQWHTSGTSHCIYCDAPFSVVALTLVRSEPPAQIPEQTPTPPDGEDKEKP